MHYDEDSDKVIIDGPLSEEDIETIKILITKATDSLMSIIPHLQVDRLDKDQMAILNKYLGIEFRRGRH